MRKTKIIRRAVKLIFTNSHFILLLNGIFFSTILYFFIESQYENELFLKIVHSIYHECPGCKTNDEQYFTTAMNTTYNMQFSRKVVFQGETFSSIKASFFRSADSHLMDALGACGSFSIVLARTLEVSGYNVRIAQMKVNDMYGGHMIVEVQKHNGKWVVLDPLFDLAFRDNKGSLASFDAVKSHWNYFKAQLPAGYNPSYKYQGARFTNWNKLGWFSRGIKKLLDSIVGKEKSDKISLRPYFLNVYRVYLIALSILYIPILIYTLRRFYTFIKLRGAQFIAQLKEN